MEIVVTLSLCGVLLLTVVLLRLRTWHRNRILNQHTMRWKDAAEALHLTTHARNKETALIATAGGERVVITAPNYAPYKPVVLTSTVRLPVHPGLSIRPDPPSAHNPNLKRTVLISAASNEQLEELKELQIIVDLLSDMETWPGVWSVNGVSFTWTLDAGPEDIDGLQQALARSEYAMRTLAAACTNDAMIKSFIATSKDNADTETWDLSNFLDVSLQDLQYGRLRPADIGRLHSHIGKQLAFGMTVQTTSLSSVNQALKMIGELNNSIYTVRAVVSSSLSVQAPNKGDLIQGICILEHVDPLSRTVDIRVTSFQ